MIRTSLGKIIQLHIVTSLFTAMMMIGHTQTNPSLPESEEQLKLLFDEILGTADDEERVSSGDRFSQLLHRTLLMPGSFEYNFSLLPNLSQLTAPGKRFRIYTWNVPLHSGTNTFYGVIQMNPANTDSATVIDLRDQSGVIAHPEEEILTPDRWYGAVYYKLMAHELRNGEFLYTLLGWHGDNMLMSTKLIEIITVTPAGDIRFGKPVFCRVGETQPTRLLFRHSIHANMSLRYEEQRIVSEKKWNPKRKEFEFTRQKTLLIVVDRLVPSDPQLEGQFEYYIPSGDVMDGFLFSDDCWNFIEDIDVRNPIKK